MDKITSFLVLLLVFFTDPTNCDESTEIEFRKFKGAVVFDANTNSPRADLLYLKYADGPVGVFAGILKYEADPVGPNRFNTHTHIVKIEYTKGVPYPFTRHESKILDQLVENIDNPDDFDTVRLCFIAKKCFIENAEIRKIPMDTVKSANLEIVWTNVFQKDVTGVSAIVIRSINNTLLENMRNGEKRYDQLYILDIWGMMLRGMENIQEKRKIQMNNIHLRNIHSSSLTSERIGYTNFQLADDLRVKKGQYQHQYYIKIVSGGRREIIDHNNSTSTLSWNMARGGERTETDVCISLILTLMETIGDLPLSTNHVYKGLRIPELKKWAICELLRLRTNYFGRDGSLKHLFDVLRKHKHWFRDAEDEFQQVFDDIKKNGKVDLLAVKGDIQGFVKGSRINLKKFGKAEASEKVKNDRRRKRREYLEWKKRQAATSKK